MNFRNVGIFFLLIVFFVNLVGAVAIKDLPDKASELYLIDPTDSNEQVTVNSSSRINCGEIYWVLPVSYNNSSATNYVFISDSNPDELVDNILAKELIIVLRFYNNLPELYYNSNAENYLDGFVKDIDIYLYNLSLMRNAIDDADLLKQLDVVSDDLNGLQDRLISADKTVVELEDLSFKGNYSCDTKDSLIAKADSFDAEIDAIDTQISEIQKNIEWLRNKLTNYDDFNMTLDEAVYLSDLLTLPPAFDAFQEQKLNFDTSKDIMDQLSYKDKEFELDLIVDAWKVRKERASFLKLYLSKDDEILKKTKKETQKELYTYILNNYSNWQNQTDYSIFLKNYDELLTLLRKNDFTNSKGKLTLLKGTAYDIYAAGFKKETINTDAEQKTDYTLYIYIAVILVILFLIPKIYELIKKAIKPKDDDKDNESEVNVDIPMN